MCRKCEFLEIMSNKKVAKDTYELELKCETSNFVQGQFVNLKVEKFFLRRPFSISFIKENSIVIIYKVYGEGTKHLKTIKSGYINTLYFLGSGFELKDDAYIFGASVGVAPLIGVAKNINDAKVFVAYADKEYDFTNHYLKNYSAFYDTEKNLIKYLKEANLDVKNFYCCGSKPFMREIHKLFPTGGQYLYEAHMGCGYGACMSCSIGISEFDTVRTCLDGPKFSSEELDYEFNNEV